MSALRCACDRTSRPCRGDPRRPPRSARRPRPRSCTAMEELLAEGTPVRRAQRRAHRHPRRASRGPRSTSTSPTSASCSCAWPPSSSDEFYREADAWWSGAGDGSRAAHGGARQASPRCTAPTARSCARSSRSSTYDEVVGPFWRALVERFVDASAPADRDRASRPGAPTRRSAARDRLRARLDDRARAVPDARPGRPGLRRGARARAGADLDDDGVRLAGRAQPTAERYELSRSNSSVSRRTASNSPVSSRCATSASISCLGRVGLDAPQAHRVQALELQDLEHVDEVDRARSAPAGRAPP